MVGLFSVFNLTWVRTFIQFEMSWKSDFSQVLHPRLLTDSHLSHSEFRDHDLIMMVNFCPTQQMAEG